MNARMFVIMCVVAITGCAQTRYLQSDPNTPADKAARIWAPSSSVAKVWYAPDEFNPSTYTLPITRLDLIQDKEARNPPLKLDKDVIVAPGRYNIGLRCVLMLYPIYLDIRRSVEVVAEPGHEYALNCYRPEKTAATDIIVRVKDEPRAPGVSSGVSSGAVVQPLAHDGHP